MPEVGTFFEEIASHAQKVLKYGYSTEYETYTAKSMLEICANCLSIYNSERTDYSALYKIVEYIEEAQVTVTTSSNLKAVAEIMHESLKNMIVKYRLGSVTAL